MLRASRRDPADNGNLGVGRADRPADALPFRDYVGVLISSEPIEGLDPAVEVSIDKRMDGFREFILAAASRQSAYTVP